MSLFYSSFVTVAVIKMWTMQDIYILSGIRHWRRLLGFLREPGQAEGALMHPRMWSVCCILVLLSCSWLFQNDKVTPVLNSGDCTCNGTASFARCVSFAFKRIRVLRQFAYIGFSMDSAKLDFGSWADVCDRGKISCKIREKAKKWFL